MQKLDLWRWAQYTIVGIFFLLALAFAPSLSAGSLSEHIPQEPLSLTVFIAALVAYLCGLVIWHASLHLSYYTLYLVFRVFKKKALGTRDYHKYRVELFRLFISNIKKARTNAELSVDEELGQDIPDYEHIALELYRCSESMKGYLGTKLTSSWQTCTMMLALLAAIVPGVLVAMVSLLNVSVTGNWQHVPLQIAKLIAFVVVYFALGLSLLQRNRLMVRDLVLAYILRKEKAGSGQTDEADG